VPLAHIVEAGKVIAGFGEELFQLRFMVPWATDKARIRTATALERYFDEAKQLIPHVFAHQQSADLFPSCAPHLTLKAFN
jgi:hypothetical protein